MDSICDNSDAAGTGGNAGAVVPGETSIPTVDAAAQRPPRKIHHPVGA